MESTLPKMLYIHWQLDREGKDELKDNALESLILMGENPGSYGVIRQKGGLMKSYRSDAGGTLYIGQKGEGLFIQTGGTNYSTPSRADRTSAPS